LKYQPPAFLLVILFQLTTSDFIEQFVQQSFCDETSKQFSFKKSNSVKSLDDLTKNWDMSKLTSTAYSEESKHFLFNILFKFECRCYLFSEFSRTLLVEV
jgi:hypothetical protein